MKSIALSISIFCSVFLVIIASANTQEISSAEDLIKFEINGKTVTLKDELGKKIYDLYKRKTQLRSIANSCYNSIQNGQECAEYNKNGLDKYLTEAVNFYQVYDQILTVEFDGKVYRLDDEIAKNPDNKRWVVDCADITAQNGSNKFNKSGSSCDDNLRFRSEFIKALSQKKEAIQTASNSNASANTQEISSAEDLIKFEINGKTVTLKDELGKKIYDLFENKNGLLAQAERCFENMPTIGTECPSQQKPKFDRILKEAVNAYLIHDKKLISDKGAEFLTNIKMYDYVAQNLKCPTEKLIENTEDRFEDYLSENKFYMDENFQSSLDSQAESNASGVLFKGHDLSNPNFAEIPMVYFLGTAFKGELINCDEYVSLAIEFRGSTKTKEELHALFVEKASQKKLETEKQIEEQYEKYIKENLLVVSQLKNKQAQLLSENSDIFLDQRFKKSKFSKNYPDQQMDFMHKLFKYRSLTSTYYSSLTGTLTGTKDAPSEREGYKSLETAFHLFTPYFYKDGGTRKRFPINGLTFAHSDNVEVDVQDWYCYVVPPKESGGKQPICSIFWQRKNSKGNVYTATVPVWVDDRGWGDTHDKVISQNPKRFVGDQLKISGKNLWMYPDEIYGAKNKAGFESRLNQIVIEGLTWEIAIEDAVGYDLRKRFIGDEHFYEKVWSWK